MNPRFFAFWAINGPLDRETLTGQLDGFRKLGFDGVVWHPRFYPGKPPYLGRDYLGELAEIVLAAKARGLAFWLYDENGWPSGTVGGRMLSAFPEARQRYAGLSSEKTERCLGEWITDGKRWYVGEFDGPGVDYLNPSTAGRFLAMTHEVYRDGLSPESWEHIDAIFCDEPEFGLGHAYDQLPRGGAIPWTPGMEGSWGADRLRLIFEGGDGAAAVRVAFWEEMTDRFCRSFLDPLNDWCRRHGKRFAAHIKGEEHPYFQVPMVGSCSRIFGSIGLPGIDTLGRLPVAPYFARQLVSSAAQFGDGRCMAESFGGAGWGATPGDLVAHLSPLARAGVTDFVLHLSQGVLTSDAIRDWPPSIPLHFAARGALPDVFRTVKQAAERLPSADTLVVSPHRKIMEAFVPSELGETNIHDANTYPDSAAGRINRDFLSLIERLEKVGVVWHTTDERTFAGACRRPDGSVKLGNCTYRRVITDWQAELPEALPSLKVGRRATLCPLDWMITRMPDNAMFLECVRENGRWTASVDCELPGPVKSCLQFADDVFDVEWDGAPVHGSVVLSAARHRLTFRCRGNVGTPFAWLLGNFLVRSAGGYTTEEGHLVTEGPFVLTGGTPVCGELVSAGLPFCGEPVWLTARCRLEEDCAAPAFVGTEAAAVKVGFDGGDDSWTWGPEWKLARPLRAGVHSLELRLVPRAFNFFGPHHYYRGDAPLVSPDQFRGIRNFADPPDAPQKTLVDAWRFRPLIPPTHLAL